MDNLIQATKENFRSLTDDLCEICGADDDLHWVGFDGDAVWGQRLHVCDHCRNEWREEADSLL